jgi:hypothetical protein
MEAEEKGATGLNRLAGGSEAGKVREGARRGFANFPDRPGPRWNQGKSAAVISP